MCPFQNYYLIYIRFIKKKNTHFQKFLKLSDRILKKITRICGKSSLLFSCKKRLNLLFPWKQIFMTIYKNDLIYINLRAFNDGTICWKETQPIFKYTKIFFIKILIRQNGKWWSFKWLLWRLFIVWHHEWYRDLHHLELYIYIYITKNPNGHTYCLWNPN